MMIIVAVIICVYSDLRREVLIYIRIEWYASAIGQENSFHAGC